MQANFAIIATGGKQYGVKPEELVKVEKLDTEIGKEVVFSEVLLACEGEDALVGKPTIANASVVAEVVQHGRAKKVVGVRFKRKKRQRTAFGHRQHFTEVKIKEIKVTK